MTPGGVRTGAAIREAAERLFYEHGYEATSLRAVAAEVGIQVGSLYNHINGKEELLTDILVSVMDELIEAVNTAVDQAGAGAVDRFKPRWTATSATTPSTPGRCSSGIRSCGRFARRTSTRCSPNAPNTSGCS